MKTAFVTGAEGFAGRRLFDHLRHTGQNVVAGVRNRARKLAVERAGGQALVCDVSDPIGVARAIASVKPDVIYHLAGTSRPSDATDAPLTAYQSIVSGGANVLDAARRAVPRAKVVLASACDVYGAACRDGAPVSEDTPLQPVNTFGSFKAAAESIAETFYTSYHLDITIARPFHAIGPSLPERFFFGSVARRLLAWDAQREGNRFELPDLDCKRDLREGVNRSPGGGDRRQAQRDVQHLLRPGLDRPRGGRDDRPRGGQVRLADALAGGRCRFGAGDVRQPRAHHA